MRAMQERRGGLILLVLPLAIWIGLSPATEALALTAPHGAGTLDPTFGDGGVVSTTVGKRSTVRGILATPAGVVVAVTVRRGSALVRYLLDGSLDPSFGVGGIVNEQGEARFIDLAETSDGSLLVLGSGFVERRSSTGALDGTFGVDGRADLGPNTYASSMVVGPDGSIAVAAATLSSEGADLTVTRLTPDGSLDGTFGDGGTATVDLGTLNDRGVDLAFLSDGSTLVLAARTSTPQGECCRNSTALVRLLPDGSFDPSFGGGGIVMFRLTTHNGNGWEPSAMQVDASGRVNVLMGSRGSYGCPSGRYSYVVRRNADGAPDRGFGRGGHAVVPSVDPIMGTLVLEPGGQILVGGETCDTGAGPSELGIVCLTVDGVPDLDFGGGGLASAPLGRWGAIGTAIALQPDGRILLAGPELGGSDDFGGPRIAVARFFGSS